MDGGNESGREKQENFRVPSEFYGHIRPLAERRGLRGKHLFYKAAVLLAAEMGEKVVAEKMGEVAAAEQTGRLADLAADAVRAGKLEDAGAVATEIEKPTPPPERNGDVRPTRQPGKPKRPGGGRTSRD